MSDTTEESEHLAEAESLSLTFLGFLEQLTPVERAALLLHRVFGRSPAETAATIGVSEANCRRLLRRGRSVMRTARPAIDAERKERREVTGRFFAALQDGDESRLAALLAPDAVAYAVSSQPPTAGRANVARLLVRLNRDLTEGQVAISIEIAGGLVQTVRRQSASATGDSET